VEASCRAGSNDSILRSVYTASLGTAKLLCARGTGPARPALHPRGAPVDGSRRERVGSVQRPRYCAVQPPSITSSLPVTNEDSSEARYRTP